MLLLYGEFGYNKAASKTTRMSPFKFVYGIDPLSPLDLVPRAMNDKRSVEASKRVEEIQILHELVKIKIEKSKASY